MDYSTLFSYNFSTLTLILTAVAITALIFGVSVWLPLLSRVRRRSLSDSEALAESASVPSAAWPELSVLVYAKNNANNIGELLSDIFSQDYPAAIEVIVVNDGSFDNTEDIVGRLELEHSNLYLTYAPDASRSLSRRKLSLTLGIKAARYDYVVLTHGDCRIKSDQWLRTMARHFVAGKQVVAGYVRQATTDRSGAFRVRAFDRMYEALGWIAPSEAASLTRADGRNLAYARHLFFDNKGYSQSLHLNYGDDDIFVAEIATPANSVVELSQESIVTSRQTPAARAHVLDKLSRQFTARLVSRRMRVALSAACWSWWVFFACGATASAVAWPSLIPMLALGVVGLTAWVFTIISWRRTAMTLRTRRLLLTVLPLMMWHPFYELYYKIKGMRTRRNNYTWAS